MADLVVVHPGHHRETLIDPPLLVLEMVSPDETYSETAGRVADYLKMGVRTVWIIVVQGRTGRMCRGNLWITGNRLELEGTPILRRA